MIQVQGALPFILPGWYLSWALAGPPHQHPRDSHPFCFPLDYSYSMTLKSHLLPELSLGLAQLVSSRSLRMDKTV